MNWRNIGYSGTFPLPEFCNIQHVQLGDFGYLNRENQLLLYRESVHGPLLEEPMFFRDKVAIVVNDETKLEITDNAIIIPNITKGKIRTENRLTYRSRF